MWLELGLLREWIKKEKRCRNFRPFSNYRCFGHEIKELSRSWHKLCSLKKLILKKQGDISYVILLVGRFIPYCHHCRVFRFRRPGRSNSGNGSKCFFRLSYSVYCSVYCGLHFRQEKPLRIMNWYGIINH